MPEVKDDGVRRVALSLRDEEVQEKALAAAGRTEDHRVADVFDVQIEKVGRAVPRLKYRQGLAPDHSAYLPWRRADGPQQGQLAPTLPVLAVFRALAAFGATAGMVIARAVVRDLAEGQAAAIMMSRLILVMGAAPVFAPSLGGAILVALPIPATRGMLAPFQVAFGVIGLAMEAAMPQSLLGFVTPFCWLLLCPPANSATTSAFPRLNQYPIVCPRR